MILDLWLQDKSIGHWRFSCVMSFPWRPILSGKCVPFNMSFLAFLLCRYTFQFFTLFFHCFISATGYTEYYFDAGSGKVCRYVRTETMKSSDF